MLSLQDISDRLEIQDLLLRYSDAVDRHDWDAYRAVFTDDARIDYTVFGGPVGNLDEITDFLKAVMPGFVAHQHMIAPPLITLDGDKATAKTMCINPTVYRTGDGEDVFICGLWYHDKLVRTADGWRIAERTEEKSYTDRFPAARRD